MDGPSNIGAKLFTSLADATTPPSQHQPENATNTAALLDSAEPPHSNLIYWLRGLPFQATEGDVDAFLSHVLAFHRLDVGTLASGECSGNAFVELASGSFCSEVEMLHNAPISCAADVLLPPARRPRPRYVEVVRTTAEHRAEVLREDARLTRAQLPAHRQAQAEAAAAAAAADVSSPTSPVPLPHHP
ncbi:unspecified product [Leptomonas pyrrhocoris]|uniref:Unspecified product n=1 Tax=Leptomonas pyrrhocoris TaxID=157538 RepID=A0A0M9G7T9_LEPPY|nr:unspecified product [Leptomonas pyrrhocoris]XP_015662796.1 unspecified product [Leptomonas pyrrhocoris]KPA84356.1 unspecified product [Leptomonas pyrrhocoris]KPA84357.1 unspecified product [Leptomonas pyrrhocoris]|eukprot:XP_015662795.1 unspecified product [Leptomonas pyrrhocoris]